MHDDELFDQREADAEAAAGAVEMMIDLREQLEHFRLLVAGYAEAGVGYGDDRFVALASQRDGDAAALRRVLGGVVEQIADDLREPGRVGVEPDRLAGNVYLQAHGRRSRSSAGSPPGRSE